MDNEVQPQWAQGQPTKLGWFWHYRKGLPVPKLVQVYADGKSEDGKPIMRYAFHETPMASRLLTDDQANWFYGPVTDPPKKPE